MMNKPSEVFKVVSPDSVVETSIFLADVPLLPPVAAAGLATEGPVLLIGSMGTPSNSFKTLKSCRC